MMPDMPSTTPTQAEEQATLLLIADRHDQIGAAVTANNKDPAWPKSFDTAGWPDIAERTVADALTAFLRELYAIYEAHAKEASAQQNALVSDRGRGR